MNAFLYFMLVSSTKYMYMYVPSVCIYAYINPPPPPPPLHTHNPLLFFFSFVIIFFGWGLALSCLAYKIYYVWILVKFSFANNFLIDILMVVFSVTWRVSLIFPPNVSWLFDWFYPLLAIHWLLFMASLLHRMNLQFNLGLNL